VSNAAEITYRCSYNEGTLAADPAFHRVSVGLEGFARFLYGRSAACHHEAGHAVAGYVLGLGCIGIAVTVTEEFDAGLNTTSSRFSGWASPRNRGIRANKATPSQLVAYGVFTCAGPAAERRYRIARDLPIQMVGGTIGDRDHIDVMARLCANGDAYREHVWLEAQRIVEHNHILARHRGPRQ
jgi:hypothetical protein